MSNRFIRPRCGGTARLAVLLCGLLAGFGGVAPAIGQGADLVELSLFSAVPVGDGERGQVPLRQGDPVAAGSRLQLRVTASRHLAVWVSVSVGSGPALPLADRIELSKGESINLPASGGYYAIADDISAVKFHVRSEDRAGRTGNQQIVLQVTPRALAETAPPRRVVPPALEAPNDDFAQSFIIPLSVTGDAPGLDRAREFDPLDGDGAVAADGEGATGGRGGALLYKDVADGVVLVLTDDGLGSGAMISAEGEIITNWHVIQGYDTVSVVRKPPVGVELDFTNVMVAHVVRHDRQVDLALIKLTKVPEDMTVLDLGRLSEAEVGFDVHAIGHPTGETWTYTRGYISQVRPNYEWRSEDGVYHRATVIQTQTPINQGSSGGPLFSNAGRIIGINSFITIDAPGINFAVAVDEVRAFLTRANTMGQPKSKSGRSDADPDEMDAADAAGVDAVPDRSYHDWDGDGSIDTLGLDYDHDGTPEAYLVDEDSDGRRDFIWLDRDQNGVADGEVRRGLYDGAEADIWNFDDDEDGRFEMIGIDSDGDGQIDHFQAS